MAQTEHPARLPLADIRETTMTGVDLKQTESAAARIYGVSSSRRALTDPLNSTARPAETAVLVQLRLAPKKSKTRDAELEMAELG